MIVEELIAAIGVDVDQASLNRVAMAFDAFGKGAFAIATAAVGAFAGVAAAVYRTAESGDQLAATAEKLGITTQALQELNYATQLTDTDAASLAQGLKFLGKNAAEAAEKGGDAAIAFNGIKLKENGKIRDLDMLFADVADKFTKLPDAASKTKLAMEIFGRAGTDLIPMLNKGSKGIAEFRKEARDTGYVLNDNAIQAAQAFDDALKRLNMRLTGWRNRLAAPLIEKFTRLIDTLSVKVMKAGGFFEKLGNAFGYVMDAVNWFLNNSIAIRVAIWSVITGLSAWALTALAAAGASGALSLAAVGAALSAAAAWLAATLPIIIFAGLLALLIDDLYAFATGGKSAIGDFINYLKTINPEDNNLTRLLKTALSLVFEITSEKRWALLGQAISRVADQVIALVSRVAQIVPGLRLINALMPQGSGKLLTASAIHAATAGASDDSALMSGFFSPDDATFTPGGQAITAADRAKSANDRRAAHDNRMPSITVNTPGHAPAPSVFAPQVHVTVPAGTDAHGVAAIVAEKISEHWESNLRTAAAQTGGHKR